MTTSRLLSLANKHILLGVSGSIAAYKAAELVRRLRDAGAEVRVVMTAGGREFVTPLTFQALSGQPVHTRLLDTEAEAAMGHLQLARWADAVLIAPASANCLARLAQGRADDLLSAVCLATRAPVAVAPAMNQQMWANESTRANLQILASRHIHPFGPAAGDQACGETGPGRMQEPEQLLTQLAALFETGALAGRRVVINAGPTREAIDPVRFLSNRSSGKMGFALAEAAAEAGARVVLISGPTTLPTPARVSRQDVISAQDMHDAVLAAMPGCEVFIAAAAVADYRPRQAAAQKIKKTDTTLQLTLERTPDILQAVSRLQHRPYTVGFAAETENLEANARHKLADKKLDMVAANPVGEAQGFDRDHNQLTIFTATDTIALGEARKTQLARQLIALIAEHLA